MNFFNYNKKKTNSVIWKIALVICNNSNHPCTYCIDCTSPIYHHNPIYTANSDRSPCNRETWPHWERKCGRGPKRARVHAGLRRWSRFHLQNHHLAGLPSLRQHRNVHFRYMDCPCVGKMREPGRILCHRRDIWKDVTRSLDTYLHKNILEILRECNFSYLIFHRSRFCF